MKEDGWHEPTRIVVVRSITGSRRAPPTGTCGSDSIRVLHADDYELRVLWDRGLSGVGKTRSVPNPDVDKVGAASSLTGAVMVSRRDEG